MELVQPKVTSLMNLSISKRVETAIRTSYRSFDKMSKDSHIKLFKFCFNNKHWSVFEHHYIEVKIPTYAVGLCSALNLEDLAYELNPKFIDVDTICDDDEGREENLIFRGNVRAFMDLWMSAITQFTYLYGKYGESDMVNTWQVFKNTYLEHRERCKKHQTNGDLLFNNRSAAIGMLVHVLNKVFKDIKFIEDDFLETDDFKRIKITRNPDYFTFKVIADIGVGREWLRHSPLRGVTQESTRYCRYSTKGFRFVSSVPFAFTKRLQECFDTEGCPALRNNEEPDRKYKAALLIYNLYKDCENTYDLLLEEGLTPQEARCVLPLGLEAPFVITGHWLNWAHFCKMRCANDAHPQIKYLADMIHKYFKRSLPPGEWKAFQRVVEGKDLATSGDCTYKDRH